MSNDDFGGRPILIPASAFHEYDEDAPPPRPPQFRIRRRRALILFLATCASTFLTGMMIRYNNGYSGWLGLAVNGASYSIPLMAILLFHEMGHYLQARRYHVPASLPYFIPLPVISPFGTLGAVIVQGAGYADRKAMFDIAVSGPLAGLVLAIPIAWLGAAQADLSGPGELLQAEVVHYYSDPLVLQWMIRAIHGTYRPDFAVTPLLMAGWVGIFITGLNLIPIGQLDGGHIMYTLIGKHAHKVAIGLLAAVCIYMVYAQYPAYILMVALLFLMGPKHPPTRDDSVPLGWRRIALGWLTLAFLFIGMTPQPIVTFFPDEPEAAPEESAPAEAPQAVLDLRRSLPSGRPSA